MNTLTTIKSTRLNLIQGQLVVVQGVKQVCQANCSILLSPCFYTGLAVRHPNNLISTETQLKGYQVRLGPVNVVEKVLLDIYNTPYLQFIGIVFEFVKLVGLFLQWLLRHNKNSTLPLEPSLFCIVAV